MQERSVLGVLAVPDRNRCGQAGHQRHAGRHVVDRDPDRNALRQTYPGVDRIDAGQPLRSGRCAAAATLNSEVNRKTCGLSVCGLLDVRMTIMKSRLTRPSDDHGRFSDFMRRAAPTVKGAMAIASTGKASVPLRMMNSSMPVRTTAIGVPTSAMVVKQRGFGVVAANPVISTTNDSETLAAGNPAQT